MSSRALNKLSASKLDAMYKLAEGGGLGQLRVQFKAQEDDRQHLIRYYLGCAWWWQGHHDWAELNQL